MVFLSTLMDKSKNRLRFFQKEKNKKNTVKKQIFKKIIILILKF
jgi:hypothetical protein